MTPLRKPHAAALAADAVDPVDPVAGWADPAAGRWVVGAPAAVRVAPEECKEDLAEHREAAGKIAPAAVRVAPEERKEDQAENKAAPVPVAQEDRAEGREAAWRT